MSARIYILRHIGRIMHRTSERGTTNALTLQFTTWHTRIDTSALTKQSMTCQHSKRHCKKDCEVSPTSRRSLAQIRSLVCSDKRPRPVKITHLYVQTIHVTFHSRIKGSQRKRQANNDSFLHKRTEVRILKRFDP